MKITTSDSFDAKHGALSRFLFSTVTVLNCGEELACGTLADVHDDVITIFSDGAIRITMKFGWDTFDEVRYE
jgi:hypothetical protein